eukprot:gene15239-23275_t
MRLAGPGVLLLLAALSGRCAGQVLPQAPGLTPEGGAVDAGDLVVVDPYTGGDDGGVVALVSTVDIDTGLGGTQAVSAGLGWAFRFEASGTYSVTVQYVRASDGAASAVRGPYSFTVTTTPAPCSVAIQPRPTATRDVDPATGAVAFDVVGGRYTPDVTVTLRVLSENSSASMYYAVTERSSPPAGRDGYTRVALADGAASIVLRSSRFVHYGCGVAGVVWTVRYEVAGAAVPAAAVVGACAALLVGAAAWWRLFARRTALRRDAPDGAHYGEADALAWAVFLAVEPLPLASNIFFVASDLAASSASVLASYALVACTVIRALVFCKRAGAYHYYKMRHAAALSDPRVDRSVLETLLVYRLARFPGAADVYRATPGELKLSHRCRMQGFAVGFAAAAVDLAATAVVYASHPTELGTFALLLHLAISEVVVAAGVPLAATGYLGTGHWREEDRVALGSRKGKGGGAHLGVGGDETDPFRRYAPVKPGGGGGAGFEPFDVRAVREGDGELLRASLAEMTRALGRQASVAEEVSILRDLRAVRTDPAASPRAKARAEAALLLQWEHASPPPPAEVPADPGPKPAGRSGGGGGGSSKNDSCCNNHRGANNADYNGTADNLSFSPPTTPPASPPASPPARPAGLPSPGPPARPPKSALRAASPAPPHPLHALPSGGSAARTVGVVEPGQQAAPPPRSSPLARLASSSSSLGGASPAGHALQPKTSGDALSPVDLLFSPPPPPKPAGAAPKAPPSDGGGRPARAHQPHPLSARLSHHATLDGAARSDPDRKEGESPVSPAATNPRSPEEADAPPQTRRSDGKPHGLLPGGDGSGRSQHNTNSSNDNNNNAGGGGPRSAEEARPGAAGLLPDSTNAAGKASDPAAGQRGLKDRRSPSLFELPAAAAVADTRFEKEREATRAELASLRGEVARSRRLEREVDRLKEEQAGAAAASGGDIEELKREIRDLRRQMAAAASPRGRERGGNRIRRRRPSSLSAVSDRPSDATSDDDDGRRIRESSPVRNRSRSRGSGASSYSRSAADEEEEERRHVQRHSSQLVSKMLGQVNHMIVSRNSAANLLSTPRSAPRSPSAHFSPDLPRDFDAHSVTSHQSNHSRGPSTASPGLVSPPRKASLRGLAAPDSLASPALESKPSAASVKASPVLSAVLSAESSPPNQQQQQQQPPHGHQSLARSVMSSLAGSAHRPPPRSPKLLVTPS